MPTNRDHKALDRVTLEGAGIYNANPDPSCFNLVRVRCDRAVVEVGKGDRRLPQKRSMSFFVAWWVRVSVSISLGCVGFQIGFMGVLSEAFKAVKRA